ncbi:MAG: site-specific DNA-methyltransferase [Anaerolineales bacterium]
MNEQQLHMKSFSIHNLAIDDKFTLASKVVLFPGDTKELISSLPDNSIKLIVTSPPYNLGKEYETRVALSKYIEQQSAIISEFNRILDEKGSICWQVGNYVENGEVFPLDIFYYHIFRDQGFKLRNRIIWHFGHGLHARNRFSGRYETLLWFTKSDKYTFNLDSVRVEQKYPGKRHFKGPNKGKLSGNPIGKNPSDFWGLIQSEWEQGIIDIPNVKSNHPEKTIHPCQFPIELIERCVLAFTNEDDRVFDPYVGVGSTIIASIKNGRVGIGAEKEKKYFDLATIRIDKFISGDLAIRPIGKEIHKPSGREKVAQKPEEWTNQNGLFG